MDKPKMLYVEDDPTLSYITKENLEIAGFNVTHSDNGIDGFNKFNSGNFDVCILDVMLPKMDGFELAKKIRSINQDVPIIFLTAKSAKDDRINGFKTGADDYMTKPYSIEELILKIEVFLRRSKVVNDFGNIKTQKIGKFEYNYDELILKIENKAIKLTHKEAELIRIFVNNKNKLVKREDILNTIWGNDDYFTGRSLDVFISRLRKYFKPDKSIIIENIHGIGFKMLYK